MVLGSFPLNQQTDSLHCAECSAAEVVSGGILGAGVNTEDSLQPAAANKYLCFTPVYACIMYSWIFEAFITLIQQSSMLFQLCNVYRRCTPLKTPGAVGAGAVQVKLLL